MDRYQIILADDHVLIVERHTRDEDAVEANHSPSAVARIHVPGLLEVLGKRPDPLEQLSLMPGGGQYSGANKPYSFHRETDIGWDAQGNVFVTDGYGDSRVVKYDKNGKFILKWGSQGSGDSQFEAPEGLGTDSLGHLYVSDEHRGLVQVFDESGTLLMKWAPQCGDGPYPFMDAFGIALDSQDHVYITDQSTPRVCEFDRDGKFIVSWGTKGTGDGQFLTPVDILLDARGNIYVSDHGNRVVQVFRRP